jgi:small subunit ribosomal protein S9
VSETENPDGPRNEEPEVTPEEIPAETAEEPVAPQPPAEPVAEEPAAPAEEPAAPAEPVAEEPAAPAEEPAAPVAEEPAAPAEAEQPATPAEPVAEEPATPAEPVADEPAAPTEQPAAPAQPQPVAEQPAASGAADDDEEEVAPRQRPEIPGADLVPDIVTEGDEYLDAEARAAAEAEAEAAALRGDDDEQESKPIADAAINLASGARYSATGKRKSAVARVILKPGTGSYLINGRELNEFFPRATLQRIIRQPLETVGYESRMDVIARMHGGGVSAQAGALRHGVSKALLEADPNLRGELKRRGFLTRDPRVKERKKAGLKKARKKPQFSKR